MSNLIYENPQISAKYTHDVMLSVFLFPKCAESVRNGWLGSRHYLRDRSCSTHTIDDHHADRYTFKTCN